MAAALRSAQLVGLSGRMVDVEVDLVRGLHHFSLVGLPDKAVEEAKERISAAVKNSGFDPPHRSRHRVTVSLAPADLRKEGGNFDLPIALGYLAAYGAVAFSAADRLFLGELALDGALRPIKGALSLVVAAKAAGVREVFLPAQNAVEAGLVDGITVYPASSLSAVIAHLAGTATLAPAPRTSIRTAPPAKQTDFADIRAQRAAKRALVIAAAGGHNVLMSGPPGAGKTILARAFASLLPPLSPAEVFELTAIHGAAGALTENEVLTARPFRSPHHTASYVSIVGGGAWPRPGEITLAHRGVLFLDEFPEFERRVIEALRQPLEDGVITVSRARGSIQFPARVTLVCAMNPCPCGHLGSRRKSCVCSQSQLFHYQRKISGPIVDRIDLWVDVPEVPHEALASRAPEQPSATARARVLEARRAQRARYHNAAMFTNSELDVRGIKRHITLPAALEAYLQQAATQLGLSARAYHRVLKVSRTIADLAGTPDITEEHIAEALQYRPQSEQK